MTRFLKWFGSAGVAGALGVLLFSLSGAFSASEAAAESPPAPPATFTGSVLVDGSPAAAGTVVEAKIGGASCGVTTVFLSGSQARYNLEVPALEPNNFPDCGVEGVTVDFYVGGQKAQQTGSWLNYQLNQVDLTVVTSTATVTATPGAPDTGSGVTSSGTSGTTWLFAVLGLGVIAFGVSGVAIARRPH